MNTRLYYDIGHFLSWVFGFYLINDFPKLEFLYLIKYIAIIFELFRIRYIYLDNEFYKKSNVGLPSQNNKGHEYLTSLIILMVFIFK